MDEGFGPHTGLHFDNFQPEDLGTAQTMTWYYRSNVPQTIRNAMS